MKLSGLFYVKRVDIRDVIANYGSHSCETQIGEIEIRKPNSGTNIVMINFYCQLKYVRLGN